MKQPISVKPKPRKAQSNWSYQAYFLSQRQRLELVGDKASTTSNSAFNNNPSPDAEERNRVIARMEALAASIGARISIVTHSSPT